MFPTGKRHEDYSAEIVTTSELEIGEIIDTNLGDRGVTRENVAAIISGGFYEAGFVRELISGPLDVDKMDYLHRDSVYCGVEYGKYDIGRIMDTLVLYDEEDDQSMRLGLDHSGLHSVEGFILARYFMFNQVYLHGVRRSYDYILTEFIREYLKRTFGENHYPEDLKSYLKLNDDVVMAAAHEDANGESENMAWRIVSRRHFKAVYESETHADAFVARKAQFQLPEAIRSRFPEVHVWTDEASMNPDTFSGSPLPVRHGNSWRSLSTLSTVLQNLKEVNMIRVYANVRGNDSLERSIRDFCANFLR